MMLRASAGLTLLLLSGCGAAQGVVKGQIVDRCAATGLRGCPRIADGALAYMNGEKADAEVQLRAGAAANAPKDIQAFAKSLDTLAPTVGGETGTALHEIANLLRGGTAMTPDEPASVETSKHPDRNEPAPSSRTATNDASRPQSTIVLTGMTTPATDEDARACDPQLAAGARSCLAARAVAGPFILTNLYASGGCPDELFVSSSGETGGPRWTILLQAGDRLNVSGQYRVDGVAALWIGTRGAALTAKKDGRCSVIWSGYRLSPPGVKSYGSVED